MKSCQARGLVLLGALLALCAGSAAAGTIRGSKHDLSVGGEGPVTAVTERQVCVFCHVPHRPGEGERLFNRAAGVGPYLTYQSSTLSNPAAQPGGASTLCLSCHDGTIALGDLRTGSRTMANVTPGGTLPPGASNLGTDLGDDHPICLMVPSARADLRPPRAGDAVKLDRQGRLQCTSCHSPHDPEYPPFLVKDDLDPTATFGGQLCLSCHVPTGWETGAHAQAATKPAPPELLARRPEATVAQAACLACHRPHGADERERLGRGSPTERCLTCHNGKVAADLSGASAAVSGHPVGRGRHNPAENLRSLPVADRHAECTDCHAAHAAQSSAPAAGPSAPASLAGASGLGVQYLGLPWSEPAVWQLKLVSAEYELCYKCHSGYSYGVNPPVSPSRRAADGLAAPAQTSPALAFNPQNGGLHAVVETHARANTGASGAFRGADRAGNLWNWASVLLCTDCHTAASGPRGPHSANLPFILSAPWVHPAKDGSPSAQPPTGVPGTADHLCFKCHDPALYLDGLGANTGFRSPGGPSLHGAPYHQVACTSCHSGVPHGYKNRALLVERTDPYPYNAGSRLAFARDAAGQPYLPGPGNWQKSDCLTDCHAF